MQVTWQAAIHVEGEDTSIPTLLPSFWENMLPPAPLHVAVISFFQVNFTIAVWKHPCRGKKPLQNHKHQHKALGAGTAFDSGFHFFTSKHSKYPHVSRLVYSWESLKGLCIQLYLRPHVCRLLSLLPLTICWRRHFCSVFIQEVLSSILVWWINLSHRSGILHFSLLEVQ